MSKLQNHPKGRGTGLNPKIRFERLHVEPFEDIDDTFSPQCEEIKRQETKFFMDHSKTVLSKNESPDIPYTFSVNPYRGCEHGCIYCYARPYHEFLGFSSGLDFETKIMVKTDAPELLAQQLSKSSWKPQTVAMCGATDAYQPVERQLQITRKCLEVFLEFRNPVLIVTKNALVLRDTDILQQLAKCELVRVTFSISSLSPLLTKVLEPRTTAPYKRLDAVESLVNAGVPSGVLVSPIIPGLNDEEIPEIFKQAKEHQAMWIGHTIVRLPYAVKDIFLEWVQRLYPDRASKIINRIKDLRGGKLDESRFVKRMTGEGEIASAIHQLVELSRKKYKLKENAPELRTDLFLRVREKQIGLF